MALSEPKRLSGAFDPLDIVARIRAAVPSSEKKLALHEPRFSGNEKAYLADCIDTNWVSYAGSYVGRFESALAKCCGVKHAVSVSSGTVALQIALQIAGIRREDEVLVPALTFVATANAVVHSGGIPHFVDAERATFGIDPAALARHLETIAERRDGETRNRMTGRRIFAVMPVHIFGHPADMDAIQAIADKFGLTVIEDATEAIGSTYKGEPCGSLAPLAALSFNGNKIVTTGGGGAVLTSDDELASRLRHLTTTAKVPHRWAFIHDEIGWNFRLPNINAALGLAQIERLAAMIDAKRELWQQYDRAFAGFEHAHLFREATFAKSNYWLNALIFDAASEPMLEATLAATNDAGVMTRPLWTPMHRLAIYADHPRAALPVTEELSRRVINLPSSPFLAGK